MKKITYNKQFIDKNDVNIISQAVKSDLITSGNYVKTLESKLCKFLKVKFATTCINGTAGLDIAFQSINLSKKDNIIMPVVNFIASYSMANKIGAKIYLADVDPFTGQMTPQTLINCIKKNNIKKIKAVVNMYLGGYPENINEFYKLKKKYNFYLIEDACHAFGAHYLSNKKKYMIGSCKHSDISVFSFHPVKTITTAEGGAITTNNKLINLKTKLIKNHNIIRKKKYWDYDIKNLAYNYRLSDINCALGISQLRKTNIFVNERKKSFLYYAKELKQLSMFLSVPKYKNYNSSSFHLFLINLNLKYLKSDKDKLFRYLNKKNIYPQFHYKPLNMYSFYKKKTETYIGAEKYFKSTLSIPLYYGIKKNEQKYILDNIKKFINNNKIKN